ncbi:MAG: L,D-transpeptidase [Solirubrobacterales bacterium]
MQIRSRLLALVPFTLTAVALGASVASAQDATADPVTGGATAAAPAAGASGATNPPSPPVREARVNLRLKGLNHGRLTVGNRFTAAGTLAPYVKGERVTLIVRRGTKTIKRKVVTPKLKKGSNFSRFSISQKQTAPGRYSVQAIHKRSSKLTFSQDRSKGFKVRYPDLRQGNRSSTVQLFNRLLAKQGYVNDGGKSFDSATARAVLAYRKVNQMSWNSKASGSIFKKLAKGKGGYKVKHPGSGKHVELDISRQILVLAKGGKTDEIYHTSTGSSATPTPTGTWRFYRKEPGFNNLEMYYSVYWNRGYATHGYKSVPTYPASLGCARNPIPDAKHIYDWIDLGDLIHVDR